MTSLTVVVVAVLGGGLLTAFVAFRKSGPEMEALTVGTLRDVVGDLRVEVVRLRDERERWRQEAEALRIEVAALRRELENFRSTRP